MNILNNLGEIQRQAWYFISAKVHAHYQGFAAGQALCAEGQAGGNDSRQTLWDRSDCQHHLYVETMSTQIDPIIPRLPRC